MASNHTTNYQLCQWEATDKVSRTDFNEDNQKIDAAIASRGNCKIKMGSYVGTGTAGTDFPVTLEFDIYPILVILSTPETRSGMTNYFFAYRNSSSISSPAYQYNNAWQDGRQLLLAWTDSSLSYHVDIDAPQAQFNVAGRTYHYIVIGT